MNPNKKPLFLFNNATISTPPMGEAARREVGYLLGQLQGGAMLSMPQSRPLPSIGARVHELRVREADANWRVIYRIDPSRILIIEILSKKTEATAQSVIDACKVKLAAYDAAYAQNRSHRGNSQERL